MSTPYTFTRDETLKLHKLVDSHCQALKNWIASAIEHDEPERARKLVIELREFERLFAKSNVESHELVATWQAERRREKA